MTKVHLDVKSIEDIDGDRECFRAEVSVKTMKPRLFRSPKVTMKEEVCFCRGGSTWYTEDMREAHSDVQQACRIAWLAEHAKGRWDRGVRKKICDVTRELESRKSAISNGSVTHSHSEITIR